MTSDSSTGAARSGWAGRRVALALPLALAACLSAPTAFAVGYAMTTVLKNCSVGTLQDKKSSFDKTYEQDALCDLEATVGSDHYIAVGRANAGFGPGVPLVGNVNVHAEAAGAGYPGAARASFLAGVEYYFQVELLPNAPGLSPILLPVSFTAWGGGSVSPDINQPGYYATAEGSAYMRGINLPSPPGFRFEGNGSFNDTVSVSVYPNFVYGIELIASCSVAAGGSASCSAFVDPVLDFDQATFDAIMGADTFPLSQSYRFVFSPNVPQQAPPGVPLPPAGWLVGVALAFLGIARRRQKNRRSNGPQRRLTGAVNRQSGLPSQVSECPEAVS